MLFIFSSCENTTRCKPCQQFLANNRPIKYEEQRYSIAKDVYRFPLGIDSITDANRYNPQGTMPLIESNHYERIKDSLFCFTHMSHSEILDFIPPLADSLTWDTIGSQYVLEHILSVGDWKQGRVEIVDTKTWKTSKAQQKARLLPYSGQGRLTFTFQKIDNKLIFVGEEKEQIKYLECNNKN